VETTVIHSRFLQFEAPHNLAIDPPLCQSNR
jgi:hypothetical protein